MHLPDIKGGIRQCRMAAMDRQTIFTRAIFDGDASSIFQYNLILNPTCIIITYIRRSSFGL